MSIIPLLPLGSKGITITGPMTCHRDVVVQPENRIERFR